MKFSVIGGDLRTINLAKMLADDKNEVYVFGMEKSEDIENDRKIIKCNTLERVIEKTSVIIGSIPFSRDNEEMYASFSENIIKIDDLVKNNYKEKSFGKVIDIMKQEELVVLNTIATAEGAIEVAIKNTDKIIHGSKVLILGFGRVAKEVAKKFDGISAKVTCAARKNTDLAWIKALGYEGVSINELGEDLKKYDIIINTVPQMIIDKEEMKYMKENILLIDLASTPGGINIEDAQKMNLKFVWALALPGKVAPVTSAEFIKDTIYNLIDLDL